MTGRRNFSRFVLLLALCLLLSSEASLAAWTNGQSAVTVLGEPDFTATTVNGLNRPLDCAFNTHGNLYVSDREDRRVLRCNAASSKADGADAVLVLGQADFTSGSANRGATVAANIPVDVPRNFQLVTPTSIFCCYCLKSCYHFLSHLKKRALVPRQSLDGIFDKIAAEAKSSIPWTKIFA